MNLGMPEILVILLDALLIFGPRKLPELGRSLEKSIEVKDEPKPAAVQEAKEEPKA